MLDKQVNKFFDELYNNKQSSQNLVNFVNEISFLNVNLSLSKISELQSKYSDYLYSYPELQKFLVDLKSTSSFSRADFEKFWTDNFTSSVKSVISKIAKAENRPFYFQEDLFQICVNVFKKIILTPSNGSKECVKFNFLKNFNELFCNLNNENLSFSAIGGNSYNIKREYLQKRRVTIAFFAKVSTIIAKLINNNIFIFNVNGNIISLKQVINSSNNGIDYLLSVGPKTYVIPSKAFCTDYIFVIINIEKMYEGYKLSLILKSPLSNDRQAVSIDLPYQYVEFGLFTFPNSQIVSGDSIYLIEINKSCEIESCFITVEQEIELISKITDENIVNLQGKSYNNCIVKPSECLYLEDELCGICHPGHYILNGVCYKKCPNGYFGNDITKACELCKFNCDLCSEKNTCNKCKSGYFMIDSQCVDRCPFNYYSVNQVCYKCKDDCDSCTSADVCLKCNTGYLYEGKCLNQCYEGYFGTLNPNICRDCSENCSLCQDSYTCNKCKKGYFLYEKRCIPSCPVGTFATQDNTCVKCSSECLRCRSFTQCTECSDGYNLFGEKCTTQCPVGTVPNNKNCIKCRDNCDSCLSTDINVCTKCNNNTFLKFNSCVESCGEGFYADSSRVCRPCFENCNKCGNNTSCNECKQGFYLLLGLQCVEQCPIRYVSNFRECVECSKESNCKTCTANNLSKCETCLENTYLYNGRCIPKCPTKTFMIGNQCYDCKSECDTCSNDSTCNTCAQGYFFKYGQCVKSCGNGFIPIDKICKPCSDQDCVTCSYDFLICDACNSSKVLYNGKCVERCPTGFYLDSSRRCIRCKGECSSCQGEDFCEECSNGTFLSIDRKSCIKECPLYQVGVNKKCIPCKNNLCQTCSTDLVSCTSCPQGQFMYNNNCFKVCPYGTFVDSTKNICVDCESPCKNCQNRPDLCTECVDSYVLNPNGKCLSDCPVSYVNVNKVCVKCNTPDCEVCGTDLNSCTKCKKGKYLLFNKCIDNCPSGFYGTTLNNYNYCLYCNDNCKECSDSNTCLVCNDDYSLLGNICYKNCPIKYTTVKTNKGNVCTKCSSNCNSCDSTKPEVCYECEKGSFLFKGDCRSICPSGYFSNQNSGVCEECKVKGCEDCTLNVDQCTKCQAPNLILFNSCISTCPVGWRRSGITCEKCGVSDCDVCNDNANTCEKCKNGLYQLNERTCVEQCPNGTFISQDRKYCVKCDFKCDTCSNSSTCNTCRKGYFLSKNNICVEVCEYGQVGSTSTGRCVDCDQNCEICLSDNSQVCTLCQENYFLLGNKCVKSCPNKFWNNRLKRRCEPCLSTCATCNDGSSCITCESNFFLNNNLCIDKCPEKTIDINGKCEKCTTSSRCLKCSRNDLSECVDCGNFILFEKSCEENCPLGYMQLSNKTCRKCIDKCSNCINNEYCDKCFSPYVLLPNGKCADSCNEGQVNINGRCEDCSQTYCSKCSYNKVCTECKKGYFLKVENGLVSCVSSCGQGYYQFNNQCIPCTDPKCTKCQGPNHCESCKDSYLFDSKLCTNECPVGTAPLNGLCKSCENGCNRCDTNNINRCIECRDGLLLFNGDCLKTCPEGYVDLEGKPNECLPCGQNCKGCSNKNSEYCNLCYDGFVLDYDFKCKANCSEGYRQIQSRCVPCEVKNCRSCPYDGVCSVCNSPLILSNDLKSCIPTCPIGQYPLNGRCKTCEPNCINCDIQGSCIKCRDGYFTTSTGECNSNCVDGEVRIGDKCVKCTVSNCSTCPIDNVNTCLVCREELLLYNNKCVNECPLSTYLSTTKKKCKDCKLNCVQCTSDNDCLRCSSGYVLQNNYCVEKCNDGFYQENGICYPCKNNKCKICNSNSFDSCVVCNNGFFLKDGLCVENCGNYYFGDNSNNVLKCRKCKESCKACNDATTCEVCDDNKVLFNSNCIDTCPVGYISIGRKCFKCSDNNCSLCSNDLQVCITCSNDYVLKEGKCVKDCGYGYFKSFDRRCVLCDDKNCKDCSKISKSECIECKENFVLFNGKCVDKCPNGWIENAYSVCTKCTDDNCNVCSLESLDRCFDCNYGNLHFGKCIEKCPEGFFAYNKKCVPCQENCLECTINSCLKCKNPWALDSNSKCVSKCPDKTANINGKCLNCEDKKCLYCDSSLTSCFKCEYPSLLLNNRCVDSCPEQYFSNGSTCVRCENNCRQCTSETECKLCNSKWFLYNQDCLSKCPDFTYINRNNECKLCNDSQNCVQCDSNNPDTCFKCSNTSVLYNGKCYDSCPNGTYLSYTKNTCVSCDSNCSKCIDSNICLTCSNGYFNFNGKCVISCGKGYVSQGNYCVKCGEGCDSCFEDKLDDCKSCSKSLILYNKRCIESCPCGTYAGVDSNGRKVCVACDKKCATCSSANKCDICKSYYVLYNNQCYEECPKGTTLNSLENRCVPCSDPNCNSCTFCGCLKKNICLECKEGYVSINGVCQIKCQDGFYRENGQCRKCGNNCRRCNSLYDCIECAPNTFINESSLECGKCLNPNVLVDNICKSCKVNNCLQCSSNSDVLCSRCREGFSFNKFGQCEKVQVQVTKIFNMIESYNNGVNGASFFINLGSNSPYSFTLSFSLRKLVRSWVSKYVLLSIGNSPIITVENNKDYQSEFLIGRKRVIVDYGNTSFETINFIVAYDSVSRVANVYINANNKLYKLTTDIIEYSIKMELFDVNGVEIGFEALNGTFIATTYPESTIKTLLQKFPAKLDPNCADGDFDTGVCRQCRNGKAPVNGSCDTYFLFSKYYNNFAFNKFDISKAIVNLKNYLPFSVNADVYSLTGRFRIYKAYDNRDYTYDILSLDNNHHLSRPNGVVDTSSDIISVKLRVTYGTPKLVILLNNSVKPLEIYPNFELKYGNWVFFYGTINLQTNTFDYTVSCSCKTVSDSVKLVYKTERLQNVASIRYFGGIPGCNLRPVVYGEVLYASIIINPKDNLYLTRFKDNAAVLPVKPTPIENSSYSYYNYFDNNTYVIDCEDGYKNVGSLCVRESFKPNYYTNPSSSSNSYVEYETTSYADQSYDTDRYSYGTRLKAK